MTNEKRILELIEKVCNSPKNYIVNGTFDEVADFLEKEGFKYVDETFYYHSVFTPFLKWFDNKYQNNTMFISLEGFQKTFSSSDEALKNLPVFYKEYVENL